MKRMDLPMAREFRKIRTQAALAALTGIDQGTISRLESGETTNPSNATVELLETKLRLKRGTLKFGVHAEAAR